MLSRALGPALLVEPAEAFMDPVLLGWLALAPVAGAIPMSGIAVGLNAPWRDVAEAPADRILAEIEKAVLGRRDRLAHA